MFRNDPQVRRATHDRGAGLLLLALLPTTLVTMASAAVAAREPVTRTVYVSVTDAQGAPVTDLTAADLSIKEGGKDREIVKVEPAKARLHLTVLVEERLAPDSSVRTGVFELAKRLQGAAEIALVTVGQRNTTIVDYTTSLDALVGGLNKLSLNPNQVSDLTEGILQTVKIYEQQRPERGAIVVIGFSDGQAGSSTAKDVLSHIQNSGVTLHTISLATAQGAGSGDLGSANVNVREQVLGDGAKQSGGRRVEATATAGVPRGLQQIAGDLLAQYAVTYTLPDGVKPDKRFTASVKRKGVTLRAPSAIPDK